MCELVLWPVKQLSWARYYTEPPLRGHPLQWACSNMEARGFGEYILWIFYPQYFSPANSCRWGSESEMQNWYLWFIYWKKNLGVQNKCLWLQENSFWDDLGVFFQDLLMITFKCGLWKVKANNVLCLNVNRSQELLDGFLRTLQKIISARLQL